MKKRASLLTQFAIIFILFALVTTILSAVVTYFIQMRTYKELCCDTIEDVGDYLTNLIMNDGEDFINYTKFYQEHYEDIRIPYDFDSYLDAQAAFVDAYTHAYPDKTLYTDVQVDDLPYDLQLLYYTFRHEYWLLTFEQARESFNLPYTYFLTMKEDIFDVVYQIDGERTEDEEHPGYLYMADEYHNDPETHELIWRVWKTGQKYDEVFEWDNAWGNTYSFYTPLIINGEKLGLVVAEIDVARVNHDILANSVRLGVRIAGIFFIAILLMLFVISGAYISKLHFLAEKIENYTRTRDPETMSDLRSYPFGNDEIGMLADETAAMIEEIEAHEDEIEKAAKMKTDFLANMSHEIRTPMNAVIGMAEMALRDNIPESSRSYIGQIKASGRILLAIINDILDFSKIESGKMEISSSEYVPMSMFNDVSNIIMMRLSDKNVNLDLDIAPGLPGMLNGDNIRIRQILINLANNAVKFTEKGHITIKVTYDKLSDNAIMMNVAVEDTGTGIRQEDLEKIFESFSQVDSKRNRSIEGTGLGLAISQRLVTLMGGKLSVESEFGTGSTFSFSIPQTVVDWVPGMEVSHPDDCIGITLFSDEALAAALKRDSCRLDVITHSLTPAADLAPAILKIRTEYPGRMYFVFTEEEMLTPDRVSYLESQKDIMVVLVSDFSSRIDISMNNLIQIRKPLSAMNISMIYNREKVYFDLMNGEEESDFIAPDASVLVVDDNAVNLAVAEGLLEPLRMTIMTADSGPEAIEMAARNSYDIIFMDHMMPEMDGVEATHKLRKELPEYQNKPIIALTANAIGDAKDRFLAEGLDDFVPKPIEVKTLISKVRQWLPAEKIQPVSQEEAVASASAGSAAAGSGKAQSGLPVIGDLDTAAALEMIGSEKVFWNILKEYHRVMETKAEAIRANYEAQDWPAYTIEVHALKSSSRQIGATELADMAAELEKAGKETNVDYIQANTDALLERYMAYKPVFDPFFEESPADAADKPAIDADTLKAGFEKLRTAADELDLDTMEAVVEVFEQYSFTDAQRDLFERLKEAVGNIDTDGCLDIVAEWEKSV